MELSKQEIELLLAVSDADGVYSLLQEQGYYLAAEYVADKYFI